MKCEIQWIDAEGNATPDDNEAVKLARTIARDINIGDRFGERFVHFTASKWYPICAKHLERFKDPGMHIWELKELEEDNNDAL